MHILGCGVPLERRLERGEPQRAALHCFDAVGPRSTTDVEASTKVRSFRLVSFSMSARRISFCWPGRLPEHSCRRSEAIPQLGRARRPFSADGSHGYPIDDRSRPPCAMTGAAECVAATAEVGTRCACCGPTSVLEQTGGGESRRRRPRLAQRVSSASARVSVRCETELFAPKGGLCARMLSHQLRFSQRSPKQGDSTGGSRISHI